MKSQPVFVAPEKKAALFSKIPDTLSPEKPRKEPVFFEKSADQPSKKKSAVFDVDAAMKGMLQVINFLSFCLNSILTH